MSVLLPYAEELAAYDLGPTHPMRPERFTLAVSLMRAYGMIADEGDADSIAGGTARMVRPEPSSRDELELAHDRGYIDAVIDASADPDRFRARRGIGPGDTPAFRGMHEAAALACGATTQALRSVVERDTRRAFSVAGGLHHARHDRASGFCVYNDPAVAIAVVSGEHPGLRVAYVDIDAHHGDGVEEAFSSSADVMTLSVHESGRYIFPGTGRVIDTGTGEGAGYTINVPLPPLADDACYRLVLRDVIAPALAAFKPDVVFAQCGADALHSDPLTHLGLTLTGYRDLVAGIITCADETCGGRICVTGGGGYDAYVGVPRAWTLLLAELLGITPPESVPESWREVVTAVSGAEAPSSLSADAFSPLPGISDRVRAETASVVERVRQASPLLRD
jgi:acetoin utilization protein AcuC